MKKKVFVLITFLTIIAMALTLTSCADKRTIDDVTLSTADVLTVAAGEYTIPYTSADFSDYKKLNITVSYKVYDKSGKEVPVTDGKFIVETDGRYTVKVIAVSADKSKEFVYIIEAVKTSYEDAVVMLKNAVASLCFADGEFEGNFSDLSDEQIYDLLGKQTDPESEEDDEAFPKELRYDVVNMLYKDVCAFLVSDRFKQTGASAGDMKLIAGIINEVIMDKEISTEDAFAEVTEKLAYADINVTTGSNLIYVSLDFIMEAMIKAAGYAISEYEAYEEEMSQNEDYAPLFGRSDLFTLKDYYTKIKAIRILYNEIEEQYKDVVSLMLTIQKSLKDIDLSAQSNVADTLSKYFVDLAKGTDEEDTELYDLANKGYTYDTIDVRYNGLEDSLKIIGFDTDTTVVYNSFKSIAAAADSLAAAYTEEQWGYYNQTFLKLIEFCADVNSTLRYRRIGVNFVTFPINALEYAGQKGKLIPGVISIVSSLANNITPEVIEAYKGQGVYLNIPLFTAKFYYDLLNKFDLLECYDDEGNGTSEIDKAFQDFIEMVPALKSLLILNDMDNEKPAAGDPDYEAKMQLYTDEYNEALAGMTIAKRILHSDTELACIKKVHSFAYASELNDANHTILKANILDLNQIIDIDDILDKMQGNYSYAPNSDEFVVDLVALCDAFKIKMVAQFGEENLDMTSFYIYAYYNYTSVSSTTESTITVQSIDGQEVELDYCCKLLDPNNDPINICYCIDYNIIYANDNLD